MATEILEVPQFPLAVTLMLALTFWGITESKIDSSQQHLLTPEEFSTLCPYSLNTDTCFQKYLLKLHDKTRNKRSVRKLRSYWDICPPGGDSLSCFDRYIDNIKLLKKKGVKRSPVQCPPGENTMQCFDKYIGGVHLLQRRDAGGMCEPGEDKMLCFDRYIYDMKLKPAYGKRSFDDCFPGDTSLECLDKYIKAIKVKDTKYLVKKGIYCNPGDDDLACFDQYVQQVKLHNRNLSKRRAIDCGPGEDGLQCFDRHVQNVKIIKREATRSAKFDCSPGEDDLTCFDRYITDVKLKPTVGKRMSDVYCEPGEDYMSCLDQYVKEIKLHRQFVSKRFVDCAPGEADLQCFDRHIQNLRLRPSKRSASYFTGCSPWDDDLTCLDQYIHAMKLTYKRQLPCEPGSDSVACLDQYISGIKLKPQHKRSVSFCEPGENGVSCFDRYIQQIKVKSPERLAKRWSSRCGPGTDGVQCFDQYVDDIKVKHFPLIKRSPIFCPPGSDSMDCFDQYVSDIKMKAGKRQDGGELELERQPRPQLRSGLSLRSKDWKLCPPFVNRVQCFDRYMALMLKSIAKKKLLDVDDKPKDEVMEVKDEGVDVDVDDDEVNKRAHPYCPSAMDNVQCFHEYLSKWVTSTTSPPKRTYKFGPGRRDLEDDRAKRVGAKDKRFNQMTSVCTDEPESMECLQELMAIFILASDIKSEQQLGQVIKTMCETAKDDKECQRKLHAAAYRDTPSRRLEKKSEEQVEEVKDRDERSVCPAGINQVQCFESLLHAYMHKVVPKNGNEFIGR